MLIETVQSQLTIEDEEERASDGELVKAMLMLLEIKSAELKDLVVELFKAKEMLLLLLLLLQLLLQLLLK